MTQEDPKELARWRQHVADAHTQVVAGRYADAVRLFTEALGPLRALLGSDAPEVVELLEDRETARDMGQLAAFVDEVGFRYGPPRPPDADGGGSH